MTAMAVLLIGKSEGPDATAGASTRSALADVVTFVKAD